MQSFNGKRLVVFGCGYLGSAVARAARAMGATVTALTRNPVTATALQGEGIATIVADLSGDAWHAQMPGGPDFILNSVSSGGGGIEAYRQSYVDGMASMVAWAQRAGRVETAVYTSSTSVYPHSDGARVDERSSVGGSERADLLLAAEDRMVQATGLWRRWFVLRLAGIYGPGRHYLSDQVRSGAVAGVGGHHLNLIHRDDAVAAILACFAAPGERGSARLNVADDGAAPKSVVAAWLAQQLGLPAPSFSGESVSARRGITPDRVILNHAIKEHLGWRPSYPTFREGYGSFLSR